MRPIDADKLDTDKAHFAIPIVKIRTAPTLDVEPVTYCKDCSMWKGRKASKKVTYAICELFYVVMKRTDFCSRGESKGECK